MFGAQELSYYEPWLTLKRFNVQLQFWCDVSVLMVMVEIEPGIHRTIGEEKIEKCRLWRNHK